MNYPEVAERLSPYLTKYFKSTGGSSSGSGISVHALDGDQHTGTLASSQAPQFALLDGSRTFTGNIIFSGSQTVDGVDISAHALNPAAHHSPVTAGGGISVSGQQVSIADSAAGNGLVAASGILAVGAGTAISVAADSVSVVYNTSKGLTVNGVNQLEVNIDTSKGLAFIAGQLTISRDSNSGLTFAVSGGIALGTPISVSLVSTNAVTGVQHSHAVVSSSNPGASASLLATDGNGYLSVVRLAATERVTTPLVINSGSMTIQTTSGDLTIDPSGNVVFPNSQTIRTTTFSSGLSITGFQINEVTSGTSALTIGVISVDELRAKVFVADEVRVDRGEQVWAKSFGIVETEFFTPAATGGDGVAIWFENSPAVAGAIFTNADWLRFRIFDATSGLTIANIWGQVYSAASGAVPGYSLDGTNNRQQWRFVLRLGTTSYKVKKGTVCIDYGAVGQPYIFLSAVDPAGAPYIKFQKWTGSNPYTAANIETNVVIGNLQSVFGASNESGFAAGDGFTTADSYVRMSNQGVYNNNVDSTWYISGNAQIKISALSGIDINLGTNSYNAIQWQNGIGGTVRAEVNAYTDGTATRLNMTSYAPTNSAYNASVYTWSQSDASYVYIRTVETPGGTREHWFGSSEVYLNTNKLSVAPVGTSRLYLTGSWQNLAGAETSEISNDIGSTYKTLMIAGNKSFDGTTRRINLYDNVYVNSQIEIGQRFSGNQSRITGKMGGATISLASSGFGYGGAVMFNAYLSAQTAHIYSGGMSQYAGAQYTGNVTRPGMFYYDANANYFAWYIGENALVEGNSINSWSQKMRMDNNGVLSLSGGSGGGAIGAAIAMLNITTAPVSNPTGGGVLYTQSGALKYRGSSGTVTTLAVA